MLGPTREERRQGIDDAACLAYDAGKVKSKSIHE
jgi:hypothetical protein